MRVLCRRTNKEYTKYCLAYSLFQSTSSVWRTTILDAVVFPHRAISIHVLHVEDDGVNHANQLLQQHFNPRPPCGGRPSLANARALLAKISIRVLRVEDDKYRRAASIPSRHFNPRPPCGGRREDCMVDEQGNVFQSTSSVWRTIIVR